MTLPTNDQDRKALPVFDGTWGYFPDALVEVAHVSKVGNDQHNPGEPLHWARGKSMDQMNTALRHMLDHNAGKVLDADGTYHLAKAAWRILAQLQLVIEDQTAKQNASDEKRKEYVPCPPVETDQWPKELVDVYRAYKRDKAVPFGWATGPSTLVKGDRIAVEGTAGTATLGEPLSAMPVTNFANDTVTLSCQNCGKIYDLRANELAHIRTFGLDCRSCGNRTSFPAL